MTFAASVLDVLACPLCRGRLAARAGGDEIVCNECESSYPILAGVPILVLRPADYLSRYRESVITTLAEFGVIDDDHLDRIDGYVALAGPTETQRFNDDWVDAEQGDDFAPVHMSEYAARFAAFVESTDGHGPVDRVAAHLSADGPIVEVGPGAGVLSCELAGRGQPLVLADISLRAVMTARDRCFEAGFGDVFGAVFDASEMPLAEGSLGALVAANVIDLVDDPDGFAIASHEALSLGGQCLVSTPAPNLGDPSGGDDRLAAVMADAGFEVIAVEDGIPWLRRHSGRETQVFFTQLVVATARRLH